MNDCFLFDGATWTELTCDDGEAPTPRWGHSLTRIGRNQVVERPPRRCSWFTQSQYLLLGGRDAGQVLRDAFILTITSVSSSPRAPWPVRRGVVLYGASVATAGEHVRVVAAWRGDLIVPSHRDSAAARRCWRARRLRRRLRGRWLGRPHGHVPEREAHSPAPEASPRRLDRGVRDQWAGRQCRSRRPFPLKRPPRSGPLGRSSPQPGRCFRCTSDARVHRRASCSSSAEPGALQICYTSCE
jgi:hypothetical protein